MKAFQRAPHFLLDARLMLAWAKALDEVGETDKARFVAARLREFHNEQADEFFAPCAPPPVAREPWRRTGRCLGAGPPRSGGAAFPVPRAGKAGQLPRLQVSADAASPASACQSPDLPPRFSSTRTSPITMPRSTALHMS